MNRTLAIIKPDAVEAGHLGAIIQQLEEASFRVRAVSMRHLTREQAESFYAVHSERPFYGSLVEFMTSGPCAPMVLDGEDAVSRLRTVIGATDPNEAEEGTVRERFAESKERNAIHASDSPENARREIGFFYSEAELLGLKAG